MKDTALLFVDIDGVFNKWFGIATNVNVGTIPGDIVDINLTEFLHRLISKANSKNHDIKIIGCSSWFLASKPEKNVEIIKRLKNHAKLEISDVVNNTGGYIGRCTAVLDYVVEHKPKYWCVIDDGDYYSSQEQITHPFFNDRPYYDIMLNVVAPHGRYGLSGHDLENILQVLGIVDTSFGSALNSKAVQLKFKEYLKGNV